MNDVIDNCTLRDFNQEFPYHTWSDFKCNGPPHRTTFVVDLFIEDEQFEGYGSSKKKAKTNAILNFKRQMANKNISTVKNNKRKLNEEIVMDKQQQKRLKKHHIPLIWPSAVSTLHELFPGKTFEFNYEPRHGLLETMSVIVNDCKYIGYGQNKKEAKEIACRNALKALYDVLPMSDKFRNIIQSLRIDYSESKIIDYFAFITNDAYKKLEFKLIKHKDYAVIASIIKMTADDLNSAEVVCMATGTRCLSGDYLSLGGEVLHDCHAEALSRRCLIKYFYREIIASFNGEESIFVIDRDQCKFKLSPGTKFHFYTNTAPCGEARMISFNDSLNIINRFNCGLLRVKIENGAGTKVVNNQKIQAFDSMAQGERLMTMSCTDKFRCWNILGVQGSLLTNLVEPIYFDSISIGSVFNLDHMKRVIYGQIEEVCSLSLPQGYKVHKPQLRGYEVLPRRSGVPSPFSVNWVKNQGIEVITSINGRTFENKLSRICKSNLAKEYINICQLINKPLTPTNTESKTITYEVLKNMNKNYQTTKKLLLVNFVNSGFGNWIRKPIEVNTFEVNVTPLQSQ